MLRAIERISVLGGLFDQQLAIALCSQCDSYYIQKRMRRRTTTPPPWIPKKHENWTEQIEPETKHLLSQLLEMQREVDNVPLIRANPYKSSDCTQVEVPSNDRQCEWTPNSKRVGMLAQKIGMFPQWLVDGRRILCTLLHFPDNLVVSTLDPDTWYRKSIVGKRKAFGRFGPRWSITVGAVDVADPTRYRREYRDTFEKRGLPVKKHLATFLVSEDAVVEPGTSLHVCHFKVGQFITATGKTIDWGFQGGMHRWGFKGMPQKGTTKSHRRIGAIGSKGDARVRPGKRMPGHMGHEWRSTGGIEVMRINPEKQVMYINGCVPGEIGEMLLINDCLNDKKAVENPCFPTLFSKDSIGSEDLSNASFVFENGEYFAKRLFRFSMPSIVFSDEDEVKFIKRDKSKAKIAKVKK